MGLDMPAPVSLTVLPYQADGAPSSTFRAFIPMWEHRAIMQPLGQGHYDPNSPCLVEFLGSLPILWRPRGLPNSAPYRLPIPAHEESQEGPLNVSPFAAPLPTQPTLTSDQLEQLDRDFRTRFPGQ